MEKRKLTIHRALSELKLIDSRIDKAISVIDSVNFHQKGKKISNMIEKEAFEKNALSKIQSAQDLIKEKSKIKSAIVQSNAITIVKVAGEQMTVADAITKKSNIALDKALISRLRENRRVALIQFNKNNENVQLNVQKLLEMTFGKDNVKVGSADVEAVRKPYVEANEFHLIEPFSLEQIEELEKKIGDFESEIDAVLSESNALTFVEI